MLTSYFEISSSLTLTCFFPTPVLLTGDLLGPEAAPGLRAPCLPLSPVALLAAAAYFLASSMDAFDDSSFSRAALAACSKSYSSCYSLNLPIGWARFAQITA